MQMQSVNNCPLCGSDSSASFDQRNIKGQTITNRICQNCGLVYQSPRISAAELERYYDHEYRQAVQGSEGTDAKDLATQRKRADNLFVFAQDYITSLSRHLDIGCSAGLLLKRFQEAYQGEAVGIEPGTAYRQYAHNSGLKVYASLAELEAASEPIFDLVSLAHVLEHLSDPCEYLSTLRAKLLAPEGHLLIEVPNLYAHDCFEMAHLVSYSPHTLTQMVHKAGFEVLKLEAHGRPRSQVIPLYLTLLARPVSPLLANYHVTPDHHVVLKRRLGMLRRRLLTRLMPAKAWLPIQFP